MRTGSCRLVAGFVGVVVGGGAWGLSTHAAEPAGDQAPQALFEQAVRLFFAGEPGAAAKAFDDLVRARPDLEPELWQRGLALYYADRFDDGRKQFELHRTVNPDDVENPAWHYLCAARATTPGEARKTMLPVGADARVPMREILALYRNEGTEQAVFEAADQGQGRARRNQLFYAHLYVGLLAEANGDAGKAKRHILEAAGPYGMDHYMGRVAKVHAAVRGWAAAPGK
jgi:lipoprotein NlpI